MSLMSETSETPTVRTSTATAPAPASYEAAPYRTPVVFKVAAWVATVAGIVFIVAVIFFSGFLLSWTTGGHWAGHHMGSASMSCCDHMGMDHHMGPGGHM